MKMDMLMLIIKRVIKMIDLLRVDLKRRLDIRWKGWEVWIKVHLVILDVFQLEKNL